MVVGSSLSPCDICQGAEWVCVCVCLVPPKHLLPVKVRTTEPPKMVRTSSSNPLSSRCRSRWGSVDLGLQTEIMIMPVKTTGTGDRVPESKGKYIKCY